MPVIASAGAPTSIDPRTLYSFAEFIRCSGLSYSRIRRAAHEGLEIPTFAVGRRKFIEGSSGIEYIRQLAAKHREQKSQQAR